MSRASSAKQRGILIAFDGVDSSGKETQAKKLAERLRYNGYTVHEFTTPNYHTETGKELKLRLQNKLGNWAETPWEQKMRLFADNRAENREQVTQALAAGEIVMYDRYVQSSLAFMTIEALASQAAGAYREEVQAVTQQYEYEHNQMPKESVSIFLDVPPAVSAELLEKRKEKLKDEDEYTDHLDVQQRLYNEYKLLCENNPSHYLRIACVTGTELLGVAAVSELVWEGLKVKFPWLA